MCESGFACQQAGTSFPPSETAMASLSGPRSELSDYECECCYAPDPHDVTQSSNQTVVKSPVERAVAAAFMIGTALFAVLGNMLVIVAVCTTKRLKTVTNHYVVSLAVSDILVGSVILPFAISIEVAGRWIFSNIVCKLWVAFDVLLCTASILNLCCIALDRYFAITQPLKYVTRRSRRTARATIASAWVLSAIISLPPFLGWIEDPNELDETQCYLIRVPGYVVFSAIGSFYAPVVLLLVLYIRIFRIAQQRRRLSIFKEAAAASVVAIRRCARGMVAPGADNGANDGLLTPANGTPKTESGSGDNSLCSSRYAQPGHALCEPRVSVSDASACLAEIVATPLTDSGASSLRAPRETKRRISFATTVSTLNVDVPERPERSSSSRSRSFRKRESNENQKAVSPSVQIMVDDGRYVASLPGLDVDITEEYDRIMREQTHARRMPEVSSMLSQLPTNFLFVMSARSAGLGDSKKQQGCDQTPKTQPASEDSAMSRGRLLQNV